MQMQSVTVVNSVHRNLEKHFKKNLENKIAFINGTRTVNPFYLWYQNYPYEYVCS